MLFCSDIHDFRVKAKLGTGTFGEVYLGYNITSHEEVAIKVYRFGKLSLTKMLQEIIITQRLCHRNIARLLHVVQQELTAFPALIFEYVADATLDSVASELTPHEVKYYAHQMLSGLKHAHDRGVVHRDLKPANIVVNVQRGVLKIIDWGLSEIYSAGKYLMCSILDAQFIQLVTCIWNVTTVNTAYPQTQSKV